MAGFAYPGQLEPVALNDTNAEATPTSSDSYTFDLPGEIPVSHGNLLAHVVDLWLKVTIVVSTDVTATANALSILQALSRVVFRLGSGREILMDLEPEEYRALHLLEDGRCVEPPESVTNVDIGTSASGVSRTFYIPILRGGRLESGGRMFLRSVAELSGAQIEITHGDAADMNTGGGGTLTYTSCLTEVLANVAWLPYCVTGPDWRAVTETGGQSGQFRLKGGEAEGFYYSMALRERSATGAYHDCWDFNDIQFASESHELDADDRIALFQGAHGSGEGSGPLIETRGNYDVFQPFIPFGTTNGPTGTMIPIIYGGDARQGSAWRDLRPYVNGKTLTFSAASGQSIPANARGLMRRLTAWSEDRFRQRMIDSGDPTAKRLVAGGMTIDHDVEGHTPYSQARPGADWLNFVPKLVRL